MVFTVPRLAGVTDPMYILGSKSEGPQTGSWEMRHQSLREVAQEVGDNQECVVLWEESVLLTCPSSNGPQSSWDPLRMGQRGLALLWAPGLPQQRGKDYKEICRLAGFRS